MVAREINALCQTLKELNLPYKCPVIFCDNKAAISLMTIKRECAGMKDLMLEELKLREYFRDGLMRIRYVDTMLNIADIFTKNLGSKQFCFLRDKLLKGTFK